MSFEWSTGVLNEKSSRVFIVIILTILLFKNLSLLDPLLDLRHTLLFYLFTDFANNMNYKVHRFDPLHLTKICLLTDLSTIRYETYIFFLSKYQ